MHIKVEESDEEDLTSALAGSREDFSPGTATKSLLEPAFQVSDRSGLAPEVLGSTVSGSAGHVFNGPAKENCEVNVEDDLQTWSEDALFRRDAQIASQSDNQQCSDSVSNSDNSRRRNSPVGETWSRLYQQGRHAMENASRKILEKGSEVSTSLDQKFRPPERPSAGEQNRLSRNVCGPSDEPSSRPSREACSAPQWPSMTSRSGASASTSDDTSEGTKRVSTGKAMSTFGAVTRTIMAGRRNFKELKSRTSGALESLDERFRISEKAGEFQNATSEALESLDERFKISEKVADLDQSILDGAGDKAIQRLREAGANSESQPRTQKIWSELNKTFVKAAVRIASPRPLFEAVDPGALCYYDASVFSGVAGCVALTMDDAPCSQPDPAQCLLKEVRDILAEFDAKATFFLCTNYVPEHEAELIEMLRHGHEIGNHGGEDRAYSADTEEDFEREFLGFEAVCERIRRVAAQSRPEPSDSTFNEQSTTGEHSKDERNDCVEPSQDKDLQCPDGVVLPRRPGRWFRAPHADASPAMRKVLKRHGFTHVLCDCFANDTNIADPKFIADAMLDSLDPAGGSILVLHMPERGFREYNLETLRFLLTGLREKKLRTLTVTGLTDAAWEGGIQTQGEPCSEHTSIESRETMH